MRVGRIAVAALIIALLMRRLLVLRFQEQRCGAVLPRAAAEVPRGRVIVVFNPFRNRDSENTTERLIRDLKTGGCQRVVQSLSGGKDYHPRVCLVMGKTGSHNLIWREDGEQSRVLVYDIPEEQARLWITFRRHESGFEVSSVSVGH